MTPNPDCAVRKFHTTLRNTNPTDVFPEGVSRSITLLLTHEWSHDRKAAASVTTSAKHADEPDLTNGLHGFLWLFVAFCFV